MQPDLREALLDSGEKALKPVDLQVGMNAALHEHASAAHLDGFGDLLVDLFELEDVSLIRAGPLQRAIKGAERAVFGTEICVVDIAIDDVSDHALGMQAPAHGVRLEPQPDQVGRVEIIAGLIAGQRHTLILPTPFTGSESGAIQCLTSRARLTSGVFVARTKEKQSSSPHRTALRPRQIGGGGDP